MYIHISFFSFPSPLSIYAAVNECTENSTRLLLGEELDFLQSGQHLLAEFIYDELSRGRVEICHDGQYRAVCADVDEGWDNRDAMVVCRELGFSPYG